MSSDTLYKLETSQAHLIRDSEVLKGHESLAVHLILMTLIQEQLVLYTRFCEDPSAIHDWVTGEHVNLETGFFDGLDFSEDEYGPQHTIQSNFARLRSKLGVEDVRAMILHRVQEVFEIGDSEVMLFLNRLTHLLQVSALDTLDGIMFQGDERFPDGGSYNEFKVGNAINKNSAQNTVGIVSSILREGVGGMILSALEGILKGETNTVEIARWIGSVESKMHLREDDWRESWLKELNKVEPICKELGDKLYGSKIKLSDDEWIRVRNYIQSRSDIAEMRLASTSKALISFHLNHHPGKKESRGASDFTIYDSGDGKRKVTLQTVARKRTFQLKDEPPSKDNLPEIYAFLLEVEQIDMVLGKKLHDKETKLTKGEWSQVQEYIGDRSDIKDIRRASTSVDSITFHQGQKSRTKLARDFIIYESEDGEASVTLQSVATKLLSSEQRIAPSKTNLPPVYAFLTGQDRDTPEAQRPPQQSQKIICAVKFVPVTADRADSLTKNGSKELTNYERLILAGYVRTRRDFGEIQKEFEPYETGKKKAGVISNFWKGFLKTKNITHKKTLFRVVARFKNREQESMSKKEVMETCLLLFGDIQPANRERVTELINKESPLTDSQKYEIFLCIIGSDIYDDLVSRYEDCIDDEDKAELFDCLKGGSDVIHDYSVRQLAACIVMEDDDDINSLSVHKRAEAMDYLFGTLIKAVEPESK